MTRPLPFVFSQSDAREGPYSAWYMLHNTHFSRLIPITWWEEIAVRNVNFTKFNFIFRTLDNTVIRIPTQNDVNFNFSLFHWKVAKTENTDQAVYVHCRLVRNYTACPKMLFDKTEWSNGTLIYTLIWVSVSPLLVHQARMPKQCWSVTCNQRNASQIIVKKI